MGNFPNISREVTAHILYQYLWTDMFLFLNYRNLHSANHIVFFTKLHSVPVQSFSAYLANIYDKQDYKSLLEICLPGKKIWTPAFGGAVFFHVIQIVDA